MIENLEIKLKRLDTTRIYTLYRQLLVDDQEQCHHQVTENLLLFAQLIAIAQPSRISRIKVQMEETRKIH